MAKKLKRELKAIKGCYGQQKNKAEQRACFWLKTKGRALFLYRNTIKLLISTLQTQGAFYIAKNRKESLR